MDEGLQSYLQSLQYVECCTGLRDAHRLYRQVLPSERTVLRWFARYPDLVVFPSFALDALGLVHLHLFVNDASEEWLRFPYAVEVLWLTPDLAQRVLYVHCIVPAEHKTAILSWVRGFPRRTGSVRSYFSSCGRQVAHFTRDSVARSDSAWRSTDAPALLSRVPLIVPTIFESWDRRSTLPQVWRRIHERLGTSARDYLPRTRVCRVNGKAHVKQSLAVLQEQGLFLQYLVRHRELWRTHVELLVLAKTSLRDELERNGAVLIEEYTAGDSALLRVVGPWSVLDTLMQHNIRAGWLLHKQLTASTPHAQPRYDLFFSPRTGQWIFDREQLDHAMRWQ
jgi:hypothetical protein